MTRDYVPAAGHRAFTALYDPVMALTMRESAWRKPTAERIAAVLPEVGTVIDIGAGTGTFALEISRRIPEAQVVAVDGDPQVIGIGREKTRDRNIDWKEGRAGALPLTDNSVDVALMSLLLHHLDDPGKRAALAEARRVIRPGGSLIVADWGRPSGLSRPGFLLLRVLDGRANTAPHGRGEIPSLIEASGFGPVTCFGRVNTAWGSLELLHAGHGPAGESPALMLWP